MRRILATPLLAVLILLAAAAVAQASPIMVNVTNDPSGPGDCLGTGQCSLRQAVAAAASSGDTIELGSNTYSLTQGTNIIIAKSLVLEGTGVSTTTIDGATNSGTNGSLARILQIGRGATVTIQHLSFTGGFDESDENCCNVISENGGGALWNNGGTVTLRDVVFHDNFGSATPLGGAVSNGSGTLSMTDVSFTHNAAGVAGALAVRSGTVTGSGVTFENNTTTCCEGGAIYLLAGSLSLTNSTIVSSPAQNGNAAIANGGGTLTLDNATLSQNGSNLQTDTGVTTTVTNTILATGAAGNRACTAAGRPDGFNSGQTGPAITIDGGHNLVQDTSCGLTGSGDQSNVDPMVGAIDNNGGATRTEALQAGSPAIDAGNQATCPPVDQRGVARDSKCDIGAYEYEAPRQPPGNPPPTGNQPAPSQASPAVSGGAPTSTTIQGVSVSGSVNPEGVPTTAHFEYGLDLSQRGPGADTTLYDQSTSPQTVGSDSSNHTVTDTLTGLIPGALYHVRLVATNALGTTFGQDQTFTTAQAPPPPQPVIGQTEDVKPVSGVVFIRNASGQFIPLTGATQIPTGSVIDALRGSLQILAAVGKGKTNHGIFGGAIFRLTQARTGANRGLSTLTLLEGLFKGAPSYATCKAHKAGDAIRRRRLQQDPPAAARQRARQVPHQRPLQRRHRPRHDLDRRRPLRRNPHPRRHRLRRGPGLRPPQDDHPARRAELPGPGAQAQVAAIQTVLDRLAWRHASPDRPGRLDRARRLDEPEHDRTGALPGDGPKRAGRADPVHARGVRGQSAGRRRHRARTRAGAARARAQAGTHGALHRSRPWPGWSC